MREHESPLIDPQKSLAAREPAWELFHQNRTVWPAVLAMCEGARHSIVLKQYIFSRFGIGARLIDLLTVKARQGVEVRVLADGFGSRRLKWSSATRDFMKAGGELILYNSPGYVLRNPRGRLHRMHRKTVVCDNRQAMIGGTCYHDRMTDWRETMVQVTGSVASAAALVFEAAWRRAKYHEPAGEPAHTPPPEGSEDWAYLISTPYPPAKREFYDTLLAQIAQAKHDVVLTTPYFGPDVRFWRVIKAALKRGVRVRLILPAKSDHRSVDIFSHTFGRALARRGGEVYAYQPGMIHAKLALIDGGWASVSSSNLDLLSFRLNLESGLVTRSPALCDALAAQLEEDLATSCRL